jgi:DinB superfamily
MSSELYPMAERFPSEENIVDAIDFFVLHYGRLHRQVERDFLHSLSDGQMRLRPSGLNSIAWLVWHIARYEDILNLLLVGRPQVLDEEHWLPRLQISRRDVGTGMADDEVSDLSARLDLAALRDYYIAVGRRTVEVVRSLRPEALDELPDLERLRAEGVFRENAVRLIAERERETKGWWLGQLGIAHSQSHRGQAVTIRLLQRIRR